MKKLFERCKFETTGRIFCASVVGLALSINPGLAQEPVTTNNVLQNAIISSFTVEKMEACFSKIENGEGKVFDDRMMKETFAFEQGIRCEEITPRGKDHVNECMFTTENETSRYLPNIAVFENIDNDAPEIDQDGTPLVSGVGSDKWLSSSDTRFKKYDSLQIPQGTTDIILDLNYAEQNSGIAIAQLRDPTKQSFTSESSGYNLYPDFQVSTETVRLVAMARTLRKMCFGRLGVS